ncbi:MAG: hypothetical protein NVSMB58_18030 [Terriglobales bacterium]
MEHFHRVKNNFVVKGPAEKRMRMADHCPKFGILRTHIQQGFQASRRTLEKE